MNALVIIGIVIILLLILLNANIVVLNRNVIKIALAYARHIDRKDAK